ncbi:MAG: cation:proton antiporter [Proteobacteria bacterium]|nr:cation:proton antiporter [Pseudomonadota bacterium]MBU1451208.1 cation:proton antiporter [Pseudomonadota bacterium]MBU2468028.1 cation:proton antiporter [Pseudomonadota bacterium]MBU2518334.1 cation:proton antiporter [Pseudomonadota bacterium]
MYENLAIMAVFIFLYSTVAGGIEKRPMSGPIIFMAFGLLAGPMGLAILQSDVTAGMLRSFAELSLALVLFTDAANADITTLKRSFRLPGRMLLIGLPLTIILGFLIGVLFFPHMPLLSVALLAVMLAPTDAALGKAIFTNPRVPVRIREALNVESGLNDGICVPILYLFLALAVSTEIQEGPVRLALTLLAQEIGIGLAVGLGATALGVGILRLSIKRGWVQENWLPVPVVALAFACYALAQSLEGSGFIACFVGGLLFDVMVKGGKRQVMEAAEGMGNTLALITWVIFGFAVVGQAMAVFSWSIVIYSLMSLTVIRVLPVYLSLAGTGERPFGKLFMGWFGPRGLASIVFIIIVWEKNLPGGMTMAMTVVCTVILSVIAHGLSANPLAKLFGRFKME